jgi:hypothetical protein
MAHLTMLVIFHVNVITYQKFHFITHFLHFFSFEYKDTLHSFPQIYSNLPLYKMKWNKFFFNFLPRLYFNIICKNTMKIFQKFEVGYTQTCTSMESSTMWHLKRVIVMCFHPTIIYGWFHVPLFYSKKKGSEILEKMNQHLLAHHPLDVKLCGPIAFSAPSIGNLL